MRIKAKKSVKRNFKYKKRFDRITFIAIVVFILAGLIVGKLFKLQILDYGLYRTYASQSHELIQELEPKRGEIFVRDESVVDKSHLIATNKNLYLLYAIPSLIQDPEKVTEELFPFLDISKELLLSRLSKRDDPYEPLKHFVEEEQMKTIKVLDLEGVDFMPENIRFYPESNLFGHITGFLGFQNNERTGQYGLEEYFEKILQGEKGIISAEKDASGRIILISDFLKKKAKDGGNLILTLDYPIQFTACTELENAVKRYGADSGTVIIIQPQTGALLALCNYPNYDPNSYNRIKDINIFLNPAISYNFEPGSIFKTITFAAALDSNKVNPKTTYEDKGIVMIGKEVIRNSDLKAHGVQTMTEVLEKSLNTGAVFAVQKTGVDIFRKYVKNFGFGQLTEVELPGEVKGDISSLSKKGEIYAATASFGQGIAVTPLQITAAFSAIANQGELMKPYLVDKIVYNEGREITTEPKIVRQVISSKTASVLSAMLISAVENGYGKKAGIKGYYIAGKTGTAEVPKQGSYSSDETIHTFCGFGPVDDPKFAMLVKLDHVRAVKHGADSAAPVFGKIAKFILDYYRVPPEK